MTNGTMATLGACIVALLLVMSLTTSSALPAAPGDPQSRSLYSMGLGKRGPYGGQYSFGLGKRARSAYGFGLGKRGGDEDVELVVEDPADYFATEEKRSRPYSFGLGKRAKPASFYSFGLGKR